MLSASLLISGMACPTDAFAASKKKQKAKTEKSAGKSKSKSSGAKSGSKSGGKSNGNAGNKSASKPKTSQELKREQENAQQEVKRTQEELRRNEANIKKGLSELTRLEDDIKVSKKESDALTAQVKKLDSDISSLEKSIAENRAQIDKLREEYLKAVKKMRVSRKRNSELAYIFGAKNMAQAERRMRYLKEFSKWKEERTAEINKRVAKLNKDSEDLRRAKSDKDVMLGRELKVQQKLGDQKNQQDRIVAELRANGDALQSHLARKQAEVNELRNRVAAVIAEEQRKAEEKRKAEEQHRAEEKRRADEERRLAEEKAAQEKAAQEKNNQAQETAKQEKKSDKKTEKKQDRKTEKKPEQKTEKKETKKETKKDNKQESGKDYASARKRKPRSSTSAGNSGKEAAPEVKKEAGKDAGGDFASMKGSLPRPAGGTFRITSHFGKHSLPDLPDVTYDNPGIDIEVGSNATAQAVYAGTVSGVYMIPGFSTVVIVNHGDYYTVYGNIASASVKVGDSVKQGSAIGKVAEVADNPGHSELHFEVWKGREKLNPESWIR